VDWKMKGEQEQNVHVYST